MTDFLSFVPIGHRFFVKIGGCEAATDFDMARTLGASDIVAPMIESVFALEKFHKLAASRDALDRGLWINIETIDGYEKSQQILHNAARLGLRGVIVGRGDLAESMGLKRDQVESEAVNNITEEILSRAKGFGLATGVGGGISPRSTAAIESWVNQGLLDHFETRKVLISVQAKNFELAIRTALRLEIGWIELLMGEAENLPQKLQKRLERLLNESGRAN